MGATNCTCIPADDTCCYPEVEETATILSIVCDGEIYPVTLPNYNVDNGWVLRDIMRQRRQQGKFNRLTTLFDLDGNQELTRNADAVESFLNAMGVIYAISDPNVPPTPLGTSVAQKSNTEATTEKKNLVLHKGIKHMNLSKGGVNGQEDWDNEFTTPKRFFNEKDIASALQATQLMPFSNDKLKFEDPVMFGSGGSIKLGSWDMQEQNDISKIHSRLQTLESERKRLEEEIAAAEIAIRHHQSDSGVVPE